LSRLEVKGLRVFGGLGGNRTLASRFCRPQRFHFATRPTLCLCIVPSYSLKHKTPDGVSAQGLCFSNNIIYFCLTEIFLGFADSALGIITLT
jgi:hypothetical protein